ncbi:NUDIX hydrolase [Salimicrobium humidisoli]|uniref:NUDIX hydrolase n=1 Tax=Salimicrobium humidisoli TaxID=2029857 RepID=A0ABX4HQA7_9BACI|nr:NUDIX domain-containing protein [Salimicrobium humidisoli]PBB05100.1 NUDIX hydrolase [Salimicrobium humidisoli]
MEYIKVFTEDYEYKGIMEREKAHVSGEWHEVFHCWLLSYCGSDVFVYVQWRSTSKKDYPGLYDITAAGHLEAEESVADGVREVKEEIGLDIPYENMDKIAVLDTWIGIDREFAHEHVYVCSHSLSQFSLQKEEVEEMDRIRWEDFKALFQGKKDEVNSARGRILKEDDFVPHGNSYYPRLIHAVEKFLETEG